MSQPAPGPIGGPPRTAGGPSPDGAGTADVADLQQRVRRTRAELGDTVAALGARADVKARAQERAAELADRVRRFDLHRLDLHRLDLHRLDLHRADLHRAGDRTVEFVRRRPGPVLAGLSGAALALVTVLVRRRRRNRSGRHGRR